MRRKTDRRGDRLEEAVRKVEVGRREGRQRCSKGEVEGEKKAIRGRGGFGNGSKSTLICCSLPLSKSSEELWFRFGNFLSL